MVNLGKERREARLKETVTLDSLLSSKLYNSTIFGVVLYGLIINIVMCIAFKDVALTMNLAVICILYLVLCIAGIVIINFAKTALGSFIGYNFIVVPFGFIISATVGQLLETNTDVVFQAILLTTIITLCMTVLGIIRPEFFSRLGGVLFAGLISLIIAELILLILGVDQIITSWISAGLFSLYIGFDVWRAQQYPKTFRNAVNSAVDLYLDIINLFMDILSIIGDAD